MDKYYTIEHNWEGVSNLGYDSSSQESLSENGSDTSQGMSRQRDNDQDTLELQNPLLGGEQKAPSKVTDPAQKREEAVPAIQRDPGANSDSNLAAVSRLFEEAERRQQEKEGLREGFYSEDKQPKGRLSQDQDYHGYRTKEFPHVHHTLGNIHPVHKKRRTSTKSAHSVAPSLPNVSETSAHVGAGGKFVPSLPCIKSAPDLETNGSQEEEEQAVQATQPPSSSVGFFIGDDNVSEEAATQRLRFLHDIGHKKESVNLDQPDAVIFQLGSDRSLDHEQQQQPAAKTDDVKLTFPEPGHKSKHHKHKDKSHHRHHRHELRYARGSDLHQVIHTVPTEVDEAKMLAAADLAEMSDRRLGNPRGIRRHIISPSAMVTIGKLKGAKGEMTPQIILPRQLFDHQPHDMFVELDELLLTENEEYEWQEKARWIKFEEDVEANNARWGKPHVASLSFHSLLELRHCIEHGVILLDLEEEELPAIVTRLVDRLVTDDLLPAHQKGLIIRALLLKHRHVNDSSISLKKASSFALNPPDSEEFHQKVSRGSLLGHLFRSSSMVGRQPSFVLRKEDLSVGTRVGSNTSLPGMLELGAQNGSHKPSPCPTPSHKVTFSPDTDVSEKTQLQESEELMEQLHTIHTVSAPQLGMHTASQTSMSGAEGGQDSTQKSILRRIPKGAEATTVLVGNVEVLSKPIMAFVRLSEGRFLNNVTEVNIPVRFLFLLMGPSTANLDYHEIGRSISTLMANTIFHDVAYIASERLELLDAINQFLNDSIVLPPGEWDRKTLLPIMEMAKKRQAAQVQAKQKLEKEKEEPPKRDPLQRTGRPFGGLVDDIKERYPHYLSDIRDGLNTQCLATFFFIYFACLSPAITFGGLLGEKTDKWLGVSEMILGVSIFGCVFALFSGQPVNIVGATGPLLVFEEGLYSFSKSVGLDYLAWRFWSLTWMGLVSIACCCAEGGILVKFITRFTEEIFALLIALIFIFETFNKLAKIFRNHPLLEYYPPPWCPDQPEYLYGNTTHNATYNTTMSYDTSHVTYDTSTLSAMWNSTEAPLEPAKVSSQPNTALLSLVLTFSTFFLAYYLKKFRNSKYLGRSARRALGDFGVPIAIFIMVLIDYLIQETYTEKLDVPDGLQPTAGERRGWYINPLGMESPLPVWSMFAGVIPGLLVFILVYMETQITSMIVNKKERNLQKGTGYHLDLFLLGIYAFFAGLIGLPVLTVATVRSVSHVSSLSVYSTTHAPGEKPTLERVYEQRVTALAVHIMMGVSLLLGPALRQIPLAVLFGVFLYMGVSSMSGLQLVDRISFIFMPRKHHGDVRYVRQVKTLKMHLFTFIQLICLAVLWVVKSTEASLAFPFVLILTVPLRYFCLRWFFSEQDLNELDNEELEDEEGDEPDFYQQAHMPM